MINMVKSISKTTFSQKLLEQPHDKTNKMTVYPAKTRISLGIQWVAKDPSILPADSEDSDWADPQVDPSLHWAHMPFCWF